MGYRVKILRGRLMFFWGNPCWDSKYTSSREYRQRKLKFLKQMRDDLEARIAGLNAAIETMERQLREEEDRS